MRLKVPWTQTLEPQSTSREGSDPPLDITVRLYMPLGSKRHTKVSAHFTRVLSMAAATTLFKPWLLLVFAVGLSVAGYRAPRQGGLARTIISVEANDPRVKVFHDGSWGYICANEWDTKDAQVVCRMQGFWHGRGTADLRSASGLSIWLDNMQCIGDETDISQCRFEGWGRQGCSVDAVGAVSCDTSVRTQVRLMDGFGAWEGRLEVQHDGIWRPVCKTGFGDVDAQVVCRMLGIRTNGGTVHLEQKFDQGTVLPLIRQLDCTGAESDLAQCKGTTTNQGEQCDNAGVECYSCGALYSTETGVVQSEDYPLSYPRNVNCLYVIRPADDTKLYKLVFNSTFATEACCDKLQVNVLTGASNMPQGGVTYAGFNVPPRLLGKGFALNFVTDGSHALQGFQAHWSPASVEDVVAVTCHSGHFTVEIDMTFLRRLYPAAGQQTIALADPACTGTITSYNTSQILAITSETDSCGTRIVATPTMIEYHNFLVDRVYAEGSTVIVRERRWEIPIHCVVPRDDVFEVHYNPFPDIGKRELHEESQISRGSAETETLHARDRREVRGQIVLSLDFPITLTAYQDATFRTEDSVPLHRRLKEEIDLRVHLQGGDEDLKLVLQNCYARPLPDANTTYYIIQDRCPVDTGTEILEIRAHHTDFRFTAFEFAGDFPNVHLTCDVRVCAANENGDACTQKCGRGGHRGETEAPPVGRRGLSAAAPVITRGGPLAEITLTFPPIVLDK